MLSPVQKFAKVGSNHTSGIPTKAEVATGYHLVASAAIALLKLSELHV